ncbi:hypothetical protein F5X68DRAFT_170898 [Plectosphaerella plurivora]|uniref:DNA-directed DNA polymerase n=1 Tax=Plectosphaerella plurivora TaxID=936078 RepID=A0A9P8V8V8_9PEZI|nr:hypothetical protein F5X68DRAFT_170898 [Plectosphaerella plurivora]
MASPEPSVEEKRAFFSELSHLDEDSSGSEDDHGNQAATQERHRWRNALCQQKPNKPRAVASSPSLPPLPSKTLPIPGTSDEYQPANTPPTQAPPLQESSATSSDLPRQPLAVLKPRRTQSGPAAVSKSPEVHSDPIDSTTSSEGPARPPLQPLTLKRSSTMPHPLASLIQPKRRPEPPPPPKKEKKQKPPSYDGPQFLKDVRPFFYPIDVNPVRQYRILFVEAAGATRTCSLDDATHIVVDTNILWTDKFLQKFLASCARLDEVVIVNDGYFPACIKNKILFNPDQNLYKIKGYVEAMAAGKSSNVSPSGPTEKPVPPKTFKELPPLKPAQRDSKKRGFTEGPETPSGSQRSSGLRNVPDLQSAPARAPSPPPQDPKQQRQHIAPVIPAKEPYKDALSEIIAQEVKSRDLPLDDDDDEANQSDEPSNDVDYDSDRSEGERERKRQKTAKSTRKVTAPAEKFACNRGGILGRSNTNANARTIEVLQSMSDHYERWDDTPHRALSYRRVITILKRLPDKLSTYEEAIKYHGIGDRLARKIEEIALTDRLRQLEYANDDPMNAVLKLFVGIYGVGPSQASQLYAQGYRTLEDVRKNAKLSVNQKVGIDHYDDLNTRIPRAEVQALGECVKAAASKMDEGLELIIGGSYRRGAPDSGDIDFIVTRKGTTSSEQLIPSLMRMIESLENEGFLVARLASSRAEKGSKWHGCCVLPESQWVSNEPYRPIWRRIDFLAVPESQMGAALIYFTGNDIFNRSVRLLASRRQMRLNEKGLYTGCLRGPGRTKLTEGELAESRDEKRIFEILGVHWREPHERWC